MGLGRMNGNAEMVMRPHGSLRKLQLLPFVSRARRKRACKIMSRRFRRQKSLERPDKAISGG